MSTTNPALHAKTKRTIPALQARKGGEKIVCLTAYSTSFAKLLDQHVDILLVGDSLGMVLYGHATTLPVDLDTMIRHAAAVVRGAKQAAVIADMPFATYQESPQQAFRNAARFMAEAGCDGVKIEGGVEMAETIQFLTARGIPVMAHVGLLPQSAPILGGYRAQGTNAESAERLQKDILAVAKAGAFSVVIEATVEPVAREMTRICPIPTIGIGASPYCDGQVLVIDDLLGLSEFAPRFAKRYADIAGPIAKAAEQFAADVKSGAFPAPEHCFGTKPKTNAA